MKPSIYEFFYYTRQERNGAYLLIAIILLLGVIPRIFPVFLPPPEVVDCPIPLISDENTLVQKHQPIKSEIESFSFDPNLATEAELLRLGLAPKTVKTLLKYRTAGGRFTKKEDLKKIYGLDTSNYRRLEPFIDLPRTEKKSPRAKGGKKNSKIELFTFDPNVVSAQDLARLGFAPRTIKTLLKYREKGGKFFREADLLKVYGMDTSHYQTLLPFLILPTATPQQAFSSPAIPRSYGPPANPTKISVDINQADQLTWEELRGIGPAYAKRIMRFREALGGFSSIDQVAETFGLPDSTFQSIKPNLNRSPIFRHLPINQASFEQLNQHPYISRKQAQIIVNFRENHGSFPDIEGLKQIKVLTSKDLNRLVPYLSFE